MRTPLELRTKAHLLAQAAIKEVDILARRRLVARGLDLAQLAEKIERKVAKKRVSTAALI
jgi:hypothetical protein